MCEADGENPKWRFFSLCVCNCVILIFATIYTCRDVSFTFVVYYDGISVDTNFSLYFF